MIAYVPPDAPDATDLLNKAQPRGWENLSGPFSWCELRSQSVIDHEEHGASVFVEPTGKIGELAKYFNENGHFPRNAYLFAGPKGIGKTAFIKLMAVTHAADEHRPVQYQGDGTMITLLDENTEEPFVINPVESDGLGFDQVQWALNNHGDTSHGNYEAYNAGQLYKEDVDALTKTFSAPLELFGGKRVVIINEFDSVKSTQTDSLKTSLDPGGGLPDGLLLLADTNHLSDVRSNLDDAGMDRFKTVQFDRWGVQTLRRYANTYVQEYGIEFNQNSFEAEEDPELLMAQGATGSIRELIGNVQSLAGVGSAISREEFQRLTEEERAQTSPYRNRKAISTFKTRVIGGGNMTIQGFIDQCVWRQDSCVSFAEDLAQWLMRRHKGLATTDQVSEAMHEIRSIISYREGRPVPSVQWIAFAAPLRKIAEALSRSSAPSASSTQNGPPGQ
jgi:DNA polymerase III delta prime subunit